MRPWARSTTTPRPPMRISAAAASASRTWTTAPPRTATATAASTKSPSRRPTAWWFRIPCRISPTAHGPGLCSRPSRARGTRIPRRSRRSRGPSLCKGTTSSPSPRPGRARRWDICSPASCTSRASPRGASAQWVPPWWSSPPRASSPPRSRRSVSSSAAPSACSRCACTEARPRETSCASSVADPRSRSPRLVASTTSSSRAASTSDHRRTWCWTRRIACSTWASSRRSARSSRARPPSARRSSSRQRGRAPWFESPPPSSPTRSRSTSATPIH
mmetsp:Transcript_26073/g.65278  ORF Transcript_26073/g.65278 Transcript_26073/m.65278 type:complete len:275 (+) Transcript_26073:312-1136(+)